MNCHTCGKASPDYADFCPYCGQAANADRAAQAPQLWEYCSIEWGQSAGYDCVQGWWEARAIGRDGAFEAAPQVHAGVALPGGFEGDVDSAHRLLTDQLLARGWQAMESAGHFRRRAVGTGK
jgi:hypothetical protein